jgi:hypothetical protein
MAAQAATVAAAHHLLHGKHKTVWTDGLAGDSGGLTPRLVKPIIALSTSGKNGGRNAGSLGLQALEVDVGNGSRTHGELQGSSK